MNTKLIDQFVYIDKINQAGIYDDDEIVRLLREEYSLQEGSAVMILASFYDDQKEIRDYIKRNGLTTEKKLPKEWGAE